MRRRAGVRAQVLSQQRTFPRLSCHPQPPKGATFPGRRALTAAPFGPHRLAKSRREEHAGASAAQQRVSRSGRARAVGFQATGAIGS